MNVTESKLFSAISATTAAFTLKGGRYIFSGLTTIATSGSAYLQTVLPDGSTLITVKDIGGTAAGVTATGSWWQAVDLCPGTYQITLSGTTASDTYAAVTSVPS